MGEIDYTDGIMNAEDVINLTTINTQYDENTLIRTEEMELLWGPGKIPPKELIDYWRKTLRAWLNEYTGKSEIRWPFPLITNFNGLPLLNPGSIVKISLPTEKDTMVVLLSRKVKKDVAVWLCCPISNYSVPATMWEFGCSTKMEEGFIAQTWNIVTIREDVLEKYASSPDASVPKDASEATEESVSMILHAFYRMTNRQYQDLPMTVVGPRVFRTDDPRRQYQRDESSKFDIVTQVGKPTKEQIQEELNKKAKEAVEKQLGGSHEADSGKQEEQLEKGKENG